LGLPCRAIPSLLRVAANNKVDSGKLSPFMKKYLKDAVTVGELVQTKSKGAFVSSKPETIMMLPYQFSVSDGGSSGPKEKKQNPAKAKPHHLE
jgi:histone H1/5